MADLDVAVRVAWGMLGLPYIWGGDDPVAGFDCSGFVIEVLRSVGILPRAGDWTADDLYRKWAHNTVVAPAAGCLAFWRRDGRMTHVEFCLDSHHTIGASGGGSATTTPDQAIQQNAYIKVRPIRPGAIYVDPFAEDIAP